MTSNVFLAAVLFLVTSFYSLRPRFTSARQEAWILSTIASLVMTLANIPFLYDYLSHGGSLMHVHSHPHISIPVARFLQAYLALDLLLGVIHYRSHLTFLTTWLHHILRISLAELVVRRSWLPIFFLCACMEAPTFLRGLSALYPKTKNNALFTTVFLVTRIFFPVVIGFASVREPTRTRRFGGSYIPALVLALLVPFHIVWFCYRLRRLHKQHFQTKPAQPIETVIRLEIFAGATANQKGNGTGSTIPNPDDNAGPQTKSRHRKHSSGSTTETLVDEATGSGAGNDATSSMSVSNPGPGRLPQSQHTTTASCSPPLHHRTKAYFYLEDTTPDPFPPTGSSSPSISPKNNNDPYPHPHHRFSIANENSNPYSGTFQDRRPVSPNQLSSMNLGRTHLSRESSSEALTFASKFRSAIPRQTREALYECVGLGRSPSRTGSRRRASATSSARSNWRAGVVQPGGGSASPLTGRTVMVQ